ncbi:unnamed protein product [Caenorhabditis brenneri]
MKFIYFLFFIAIILNFFGYSECSERIPRRTFDPNRPTMSNQGQRITLNNQQRRVNEEVVNSQRNTEFLIIP